MATKNKAKSTTKAAAGKPAKAKPGKPAKDAATAAAVEATPPAPQATEGLVPEAGPKFGAPELAPAAPVAATEAAPATPKAAKRGRAAVSAALPAAGKKLSALDAAAKVLGETATPMTTQAMIDAMASKGYWTSPGGATPAATLYAAILREQKVKGKEARFVKTARGKFALSGAGK